MKGDPKVIEFLNKALTNELTAINQYWLHYRVLADWGVSRLAEYERHESIDEMKHADILAERILFLNGLPNFQAIHKLKVGETVEEILCSRKPRNIARAFATSPPGRSSKTSWRARKSMSTSSKPSST